MASNIVETNETEKFRLVDERMSEVLPYCDYRIHKGCSRHISDEISRCQSGSVNVSNVTLDVVYKDLLQHMSNICPVRFEPIPYDVVVLSKKMDTSPGMPLRNTWTTYGDLLLDIDIKQVCKDLYEWEESILNGRLVVTPVIQVFGKRDKYSQSKLQTGRYRTIQCTDLGIVFLMKRYYGDFIERLELALPWMYLVTNTTQYDLKVARLRQGLNVGVDFTAFDRCQNPIIIERTLRLLSLLAGVPTSITDFVVGSIAHSVCLCPNGDMYLPGGLNPSGQYLTSAVNTVNHMVINLCYFYDVEQLQPLFLLNGMRFNSVPGPYLASMTGDDGIDHFNNDKLLINFRDKYSDYVRDRFAIVTKLDYRLTKEGKKDVYRDMLPPYLSSVEIEIGSFGRRLYVNVPARPNRVLTGLQWCTSNDNTDPNYNDKRAEQVVGILQCFSAYFDCDVNGWLATPKQVVALETLASKLGISVASLAANVTCEVEQHCSKSGQIEFAVIDKSMVKVEVIEDKQTTPKGKGKRNRQKKKKTSMAVVVSQRPQVPPPPKKGKGKKGKTTNRGRHLLSGHPAAEIMKNDNARAVMEQIILPHEASLVRLRGSDSGCMLDTSLGKSFKVLTVDMTAVRSTNQLTWPVLSNGGYVWDLFEGYDCVSFYDAYILACIPYAAPLGGVIYAGANLINPEYSPQSQYLSFAPIGIANIPIGRLLLEYVELVPLTVGAPYGPYHPFVSTSAGRCIWIDAGANPAEATVTVNLTTDAVTTIPNNFISLDLYPIALGKDSLMNTAPKYSNFFPAVGPLATSTNLINVYESGYYYISIRGTIATSAVNVGAQVNPSLEITTRTSVVSKFVLNEDIHVNAWTRTLTNLALPRDVQVLGSSALVTNVSPLIFRDGTVYGASWDYASPYWSYTNRLTESMSGMNTRSTFVGDWPTGCYGFVKPAKMVFRTSVERSVNGVMYNTGYVADPIGDEDTRLLGFNHFRIASDVAVGNPGQKVRFAFCVGYEFTSASQLFYTRPAKIPPSVVDDALFAINSLETNFSPNDTHVNGFMNAIKKAANWVVDAAGKASPYVQLAGRIMELFAPTQVLGKVVSGVGQSLSDRILGNLV